MNVIFHVIDKFIQTYQSRKRGDKGRYILIDVPAFLDDGVLFLPVNSYRPHRFIHFRWVAPRGPNYN